MSGQDLPYEVQLVEDAGGSDPDNDNVDVIVRFHNGDVYSATAFTLANVKALMETYRNTGECGSGKYFWAANMVIVDRLDRATVMETVAGLIATGEFESAFEGPIRESPDG